MKEIDPTSPETDPVEQIKAETPALPSVEDLTFTLDLHKIETVLDRFRTYRDERVYPPDACFFLICSTLEMVARQRCLAIDYHAFRQRVQRESADDVPGRSTDAPPESKAFTIHMNERYVDLFIEVLEANGEHEMAMMFASDPKSYRDKRERGRLFFRSVSLPPDP